MDVQDKAVSKARYEARLERRRQNGARVEDAYSGPAIREKSEYESQRRQRTIIKGRLQ